jgi:hypothetical protein
MFSLECTARNYCYRLFSRRFRRQNATVESLSAADKGQSAI